MTDWLSLAADPTPFISLICLALAAGALLWGACWRHTAGQTAERAERLRAENKRLSDLVRVLCEERDEAQSRAREWMAEAEGRAADHQNHLARCLGDRITPDDARRN